MNDGWVEIDITVAALGITPPASLYSPTRDTSLTLAEKNERSAPWLATYYSNADPHPSRTADACSSAPLDDPQSSLPGLVGELDQIADPSVINGVQGLILFAEPSIFYGNVLQAFGLDHHAERQAEQQTISRRHPLPLAKVAVEIVWCDMSMGDSVYAAWALEQLCTEQKNESGPQINFRRFRNVNHLVSRAAYHVSM